MSNDTFSFVIYIYLYLLKYYSYILQSIVRYENHLLFSIQQVIDCFIFNYFVEFFLLLVLLQHGDIETNPGQRTNSYQYLSCCHWNLNSLPAHNYIKVSLIQPYNTIHKYDIICLSETYLDSSIPSDDKALYIEGYNLVRADHPSDNKRGGVCIYYKENLSIKFLDISMLTECLVCKFTIQNRL